MYRQHRVDAAPPSEFKGIAGHNVGKTPHARRHLSNCLRQAQPQLNHGLEDVGQRQGVQHKVCQVQGHVALLASMQRDETPVDGAQGLAAAEQGMEAP